MASTVLTLLLTSPTDKIMYMFDLSGSRVYHDKQITIKWTQIHDGPYWKRVGCTTVIPSLLTLIHKLYKLFSFIEPSKTLKIKKVSCKMSVFFIYISISFQYFSFYISTNFYILKFVL